MNPLGNVPMNPALQGIAETIRFARSFGSPQAFMQELQRQNPQMANSLMQLASQVRNPAAYAQQMMLQNGINPQELFSLIR